MSADGRHVALIGSGGPEGKTRLFNVYEGPTGRMVGPLPLRDEVKLDSCELHFDTTGTVLSHWARNPEGVNLYELPGRTLLREGGEKPLCLGPRARHWLTDAGRTTTGQPRMHALWESGRPEPLASFVLDTSILRARAVTSSALTRPAATSPGGTTTGR